MPLKNQQTNSIWGVPGELDKTMRNWEIMPHFTKISQTFSLTFVFDKNDRQEGISFVHVISNSANSKNEWWFCLTMFNQK